MYKSNLKKCQLNQKLKLEKEVFTKEKKLNALKNRLQLLKDAISLN